MQYKLVLIDTFANHAGMRVTNEIIVIICRVVFTEHYTILN